MKRRTILGSAAALTALAALPARSAPTRIGVGYTAGTDFASVFVAREQGFFEKRQLDVEPKFIPLNATLPAAVQSDSLQVGGYTSTVFLQAVDGGLDHIALVGGSLTSKSITAFGLVAKAGSGIRTAADCVGKKIGVPGFGAFLHVTFRTWLKTQGVDHRKVTFVEAAFPQHGDLLRSGTIDAAVSGEPFMSRVVETGAGYVASYYSTFLPEGEPIIIYGARRDWVQKNPAAARGFRDAVLEGAAFMKDARNAATVRTIIGKYIKLPPDVLAKMQISAPGGAVTEKQLAYWRGVMEEQGMLTAKGNLAQLLLP